MYFQCSGTEHFHTRHKNNPPKDQIHFGLSLAARLTLLAPFFHVIEASPLMLFGTDSLDARDPLLKKRACAKLIQKHISTLIQSESVKMWLVDFTGDVTKIVG